MSNNSLKHTRQLHCSTGLVLRHHVVDDCLCQVSSVFFFTCNLCKSWGHGDFIRTSAFIWIPPKILGGLGRAALFLGGLTL